MKKIVIPVLLFSGLILISCHGDSGAISAGSKKNLDANRAIFNAYETGDFDKLKDYFASDAIDHAGERGDVKGRDNIIAEMKKFKALMPDMKSTVIKEIADDAFVFRWSTLTGTMYNQPSSMTCMDVTKFKNGKAVEHWVYMDPRETERLIQMIPPYIPANMQQIKDTVKLPR